MRSTPSRNHASPANPTLTGQQQLTTPDAQSHTTVEREDHLEVDDAEREEDPLRHGAIRAPLRDMVTAVASISNRGDEYTSPLERIIKESQPTAGGSTKRKRVDLEEPTDNQRSHAPIWSKGSYTLKHLDPIACGIVSEGEAERLFQL